MKILFIEPFFGGSHMEFAKGFKQHSSHDVTIAALPDRFWKWRMKGAALYFVHQIKDFSQYDALVTTDMLNLTDFISLAGSDLPPVLIYFHENQLSYPLSPRQRHDSSLGWVNIISAAAADQVLFNSYFHFNEFISQARQLIRQMPDEQPVWVTERIKRKTKVVYPGCRLEKSHEKKSLREMKKPLIVWNHRWEYDKNPEFFFDGLARLKKKGIVFSLALLGETPEKIPDVFARAKEKFSDEIVVFGYAASRQTYLAWLKKGAIVVSCAVQENFGISIVEAVHAGCLPLLPFRLSYPELMPKEFHPAVFYRTKQEFVEKLEHMVVHYKTYLPVQEKLSAHVRRFSWPSVINAYDTLIKEMKTGK